MAQKADKKDNWFKRHKILTAILAIVVIGVIASAAGGGSKDKTNNNSKNTAASSSRTAKIGDSARDGKFEFVVKSLECNVMSVGDNPYLTKTPQGQFCLLDVTVRNIGNEKQSLFSSNQKLLNGSVEYSADDTATIYAAPNSSSWYSDINPGNSVEGKIVFDIPKDVAPTTAELHDSAYSGGVKVNLQ